jgi:hypothetical protein
MKSPAPNAALLACALCLVVFQLNSLTAAARPARAKSKPAETNWLVSDLTPAAGRGTPPANARGLGPWATRLMLATSRDGLSFKRTNKVLADQTGVPNAMVDKDGHARIYYIDFGNGNIIAAAIQKGPDDWVYRRVKIEGLPRGSKTFEGRAGSSDPVDPTVVLLPDGRYRLYYMQGTPLPKIYSAISSNGIHFLKEDGLRYTAAPDPVFDPCVLRTPQGWLLWSGPEGRYTAKSSDGLSFASTGEFKVEGRVFMTWSAVEAPAGFRLFGNFIGRGAGGGLTSVYSKDGLSWKAESGPRLSREGADPALEAGVAPDNGACLLPDGTWLMVYLATIPQ